MIPYYAWAHRELGEMAVWLPRTAELAQSKPMPKAVSATRELPRDKSTAPPLNP
jgi:hypothetical protein